MSELKNRVKEMIIRSLDLEDIDIEEIKDSTPLFLAYDEDGEGLGLDSVDSLEIIVAVKKEFGLKITDENMEVLQSIDSLVKFVEASALQTV